MTAKGATLLLPSVWVLICSLGGADEPVRKAAAAGEAAAVPLKASKTAVIADEGFLAWAGPALCDQDENVYFLLIPRFPVGGKANVPSAPLQTRTVLRVSSDGKKRVNFDPLTQPKFANAADLTTITMAVNGHGTLFLLVWARWEGSVGQPEKSGQYILSFDRKGEYQTSLEVDWREILVDRFEVFDSGDFLLRGRRMHPAESRLAILSASGQTLTDVGFGSNKPIDEVTPDTPARTSFDQMARGADGRIYLTEKDSAQEADVVYGLSASGQTERLFTLPPVLGNRPLKAWRIAGDRFATVYESPRSSAEHGSQWWIAVHIQPAAGADPETTLYGPVPGVPICYEHQASRDSFTYVSDGRKLVTVSP